MLYTDNRQNQIEVTEEFIRELEEVCIYALEKEEVKQKCQISLLFVNNEEIREINKETRNIDKATDVLSFPMLDYPKGKFFKDVYKDKKFDVMYMDGDELVLGDMEYNHSFKREVCYLVVHSILHLLGYDHMEEDEKKIMRTREEEILNGLDIKR